ncbi:MAG: FAD:protein FMN transferase [Solirubrobacteraceae bacterium]
MTEAIERFDCFGGRCTVLVTGSGPAGEADEAAARARRRLLAWHDQFSRFEAGSELSRCNRDPRRVVGVSPTMARFVESALCVAAATGGLVDPTLGGELERAGDRGHFSCTPLPLERALAVAPPRAPAASRSPALWHRIEVDRVRRTVTRPPGVQLDSGGVAKGLFGDILAGVLGAHESFAVDAAGDVRFGGVGAWVRPVAVASPFDDSVLHVYELGRGAAATSGIGRRSWLDADAQPAHHLLDPATGRPAFTGIVQVTALAPTGVEAEMRSKAALLSGPEGARDWLGHGGLVVFDDAELEVIGADAALCASVAGHAVAA